jgi:hypothetical protein
MADKEVLHLAKTENTAILLYNCVFFVYAVTFVFENLMQYLRTVINIKLC